jgi:hypothetical protein
MRKLAALLLLTAPFGACRCDTEAPSKIAPQIYVDVCQSPQKKIGPVLIGGYEECAVDFGERAMSVKVSQAIKVTNPSIIELTMLNIELIGDPAFKLEVVPDTIGVGLSGDIVISVRPNVKSTINTTLYILSDAHNTFQTPEGNSLIEIPITAEGVDNGLPDIVVAPINCDYGRVPFGGVQVCDVTITNVGNRALVVDSVRFIPADADEPSLLFDIPGESALEAGPACNDGATNCPFAFTGAPPGADEEIASDGGFVVMPVRFTPDVLGNFQGRFQILSSDPDESSIDVALSGVSVTPPSCELRIASVNGTPIEAGAAPAIEPLDNVILSTDESAPSTPVGTIVSQQWVITDQPAGSGATLTSADSPDTGFQFDDGDDLGVDLAGNYCVSAQVFDDLGVGSVNECTLCFEAIPKDNFLVQLSWDTPGTDIDLHVTKLSDAGQYCFQSTNSATVVSGFFAQSCENNADCNYAGCDDGAGDPDWDAVLGASPGDPSLDIDDTQGFGPENINVDVMTPGMYLVGIDGYRTDAESGSTVRIFIFGRLSGEFFDGVLNHEFWEVALVRWPDGVNQTRPCVEDLTDGDEGDELAACDAAELADP